MLQKVPKGRQHWQQQQLQWGKAQQHEKFESQPRQKQPKGIFSSSSVERQYSRTLSHTQQRPLSLSLSLVWEQERQLSPLACPRTTRPLLLLPLLLPLFHFQRVRGTTQRATMILRFHGDFLPSLPLLPPLPVKASMLFSLCEPRQARDLAQSFLITHTRLSRGEVWELGANWQLAGLVCLCVFACLCARV